MIIKEKYGICDGEQIYKYTLKSVNLTAEIFNYGGIIKSLKFNDIEVVIGLNSLDEYRTKFGSFGAIIGRCANRIKGGKINLSGVEYQLTQNEKGEHTLHGGENGFSKKVWQAEEVEDSLVLTYTSPDGEEGFPGELKVKVVYSINNNGLVIEYFAKTDKETVCNLTNHSYFNLNGGGDVLNHTLFINADEYTPVDESNCPDGRIESVKNTYLDFSSPTKIGDRIPCNKSDFLDKNYLVKGTGYRKVAEAVGDKTGIKMEVYTTEPGLQLYTPRSCSSFCLEAQKFPNAVNVLSFISPVITKDKDYYQKTAYIFK